MRMRHQPHAQEQIARLGSTDTLFALTRDTHARSIRHAGRDPHVDVLHLPVVTEEEPSRRAVIRILERQFDFVLDIAAWALTPSARAGLAPCRTTEVATAAAEERGEEVGERIRVAEEILH